MAGKRLIKLILLICCTALIAGCSAGEKEPESTLALLRPEEERPDPQPFETAAVYGMVSASDRLTYGLSSAGLLSYTGRTNGRGACYEWRDVVWVETSDRYTLGLDKDGRVLVAGIYQDGESDSSVFGTAAYIAEKTADWTDIVCICMNDISVYGLRKDGTVLSTEGGRQLMLKDIRLIAAAGDWFAAVDAYGRVWPVGPKDTGSQDQVFYGKTPDLSAIEGKELVWLKGFPQHIVALTADGELISTRPADPMNGAKDCVRAFADENWTAYLDKSGLLHTDCPIMEGITVENAYWFDASDTHTAISRTDGTVVCYGLNGINDYYQRRTWQWRLLPFGEDGYVYGIAPGTTGKNGQAVRTGDTYELPDGSTGIAVILGDLNSDGQIDSADLALLESAADGDADLTGAQWQAADVLRDTSRPGTVDETDVKQLEYHLKGYTIIDQYLKNDYYVNDVAESERINIDVSGYIYLDGTNIDYPIMYGPSFYYHYYNWKGWKDECGSVYFYYLGTRKNTVVTGHNVRWGSILNHLHVIQDNYAPYYSEYSERLWTLNFWGETGIYEVFSMYEQKSASYNESYLYYNTNYSRSMNKMSVEEIQKWIDHQNENTDLDYTVHVDPDDWFATVLTCADTHAESDRGGRIYFFLRRADGH